MLQSLTTTLWVSILTSERPSSSVQQVSYTNLTLISYTVAGILLQADQSARFCGVQAAPTEHLLLQPGDVSTTSPQACLVRLSSLHSPRALLPRTLDTTHAGFCFSTPKRTHLAPLIL